MMNTIASVQFAGVQEVKQNLVRLAQASRNYVETGDRYNLGLAHGFAAAALMDPAAKEVMAQPAVLVEETIQMPNRDAAAIFDTYTPMEAVTTIKEALEAQIFANHGNPIDTVSLSVTLPRPLTVEELLGNPQGVWAIFKKALADNAFVTGQPLSATREMIDDFTRKLALILDEPLANGPTAMLYPNTGRTDSNTETA